MCGIAGILRVTKPGEAHEPIPESWLDAMDEHIAWRGPDGAGRFRDTVTKPDGTIVEVALVHRRLSIIDHEGGAQPMVSERGPDGAGLVAVVFNGCVYNHRELRDELEKLGHRFETDHSDTEVLIHGYRAWGHTGLVDRILGMYSFMMWDRSRAWLRFGTDRFGEKPLYARQLRRTTGRVWMLASTVPALRSVQHFTGAVEGISPRGVTLWTRFGWGHERYWGRGTCTATRSLVRSPHGIVGAQPHTEWQPTGRVVRRDDPGDLADELLQRAVSSRLEADVPVGCLLSGGVDSSLIAWYASRELDRLQTITVRMPDPRYDESRHAELAAQIVGSDHATIECDPENAAEDLVGLIENLGLPFGDSSILPAYWACRAAAGTAKVLIGGDGGDELFAGYDRHVAAGIPRRLRSILARVPSIPWPDRRGKSVGWRLRRLQEAIRQDSPEPLVAVFLLDELRRVFPGIEPRDARLSTYSLRRDAAVDFDQWLYLPSDLLRKSDTASLAAGVELRSPFLDPTLWNSIARLGLNAVMPGGKRKALLRSVARRYFPADLIDRPKQGFAIPIGEWFRSDFGGMRTLLMDLVGSPAEANQPAFGRVHDVLPINMRYVHRMVREHMEQKRDHSQRLFMLCSLAIWARWLDTHA